MQTATITPNNGTQKLVLKKSVTGSTLKIIAMLSMLMDHIGAILLERAMIQQGSMAVVDQQSFQLFLNENATLYYTYQILRLVGRIAFPIFCFLLVQGFLHTRNLKKYLGRLFLFALISEIPFDLALPGELVNFNYQNVYFTLFFGVLTLAGIQFAEKKIKWHVVWRVLFGLACVAGGAGAAMLLKADYGAIGVLVIAVLYLLRKKRILSMGVSCAMLAQIPAFFSLIPTYFYNGKRGCNIKWLFYLFYPVHILLIYLLTCALGLGHIVMG